MIDFLNIGVLNTIKIFKNKALFIVWVNSLK